MHIPSSPTAALTLERFAPALEAALEGKKLQPQIVF